MALLSHTFVLLKSRPLKRALKRTTVKHHAAAGASGPGSDRKEDHGWTGPGNRHLSYSGMLVCSIPGPSRSQAPPGQRKLQQRQMLNVGQPVQVLWTGPGPGPAASDASFKEET